MSLFSRVYQSLLPRSPAWSLTFNKTLKLFFDGLTALPTSVVANADLVWLDLLPDSTRQVTTWLPQFGLQKGVDDVANRLQLQTAWLAQGGQSPKYLQDTLQAAGFPLFVYEFTKSGVAAFSQVCAGDTLAQAGEPAALASSRNYARFIRDPRDYTSQPLIGTVQCSDLMDQPQCSALTDQPQANAFLANEPGYLVNLDLSRNAPPPIPDDSAQVLTGPAAADWTPSTWPYFFYIGGATFGTRVTIPTSRRSELERLVLKLRPTHQWVVMLVTYDAITISSVTAGGIGVLAGGTPVVITGASVSVAAGGAGVTAGGVSVLASA